MMSGIFAASFARDLIEQAKQDWRTGQFWQVPGETEFILLPQEPDRKEQLM